MKYLICGSRDWTNYNLIKERILYHQPTMIISGGCKGADKIAENIAKELNIPIEIYNAEWDKYGNSAGPIRNKKMLEEGNPDYVIAFHDDLENSKGTLDMVNKSLNKGKIVVHYENDK